MKGIAEPVGELRDEDVVADLQRRDHRARRDLEGLDHERAQQQRHRDGHADRLGVLADGRLARERQVLVHRVVERRDRLAQLLEVVAARAPSSTALDLRRDVGGDRGRDPVALLLEDAARLLDEVPPLERARACTPSARCHQLEEAAAPRDACARHASISSVHLQDGQEGLLRDLHVAHLLHPLLTFLLPLQQLALAA